MHGQIFDKADVFVENGKIAEIGKNLRAGRTVRILDASGCWVMPGLIESHCHIGITEEKKGEEGDDCNEDCSPVMPQLRAIDAINPMDSAFHTAVKAGITSVMVGAGSSNVVGGQFCFIKTHGRVIDRMVVLSPAAMKVSFGENPKRVYGGKNQLPSTRMTVSSMLREDLFEAKHYQKQKERAKITGSDFKPDFKWEAYLPVLEKRIPLKAHVHRTDDILTAIRIAKEFDLMLTLDHCSEGHLIASEIKESGFPAIVGPTLASRNKIEIQYMDFKTAGILHKAGVKVSITTDHPVSGIQYLPICAGYAAKEGLGVEEGLRAITLNAAEICNVSDRVGSLEIGKDADIAVFDGNPMEVFTRTRATVIDGEVVYDSEYKRE